jgi:hypothetical protein
MDFRMSRDFDLIFPVRPDIMVAAMAKESPAQIFELPFEFPMLHS